MLRFGKNFMQASTQSKMEICRDLHCRQDGLPWTSHPALEGTECGPNMVSLMICSEHYLR